MTNHVPMTPPDPEDDEAGTHGAIAVALPHDPLSLENQLCFSLYAAARAVKNAYKQKLEELGLTYTQYLVMIVLWGHDGLTVASVGRELQLDSGTITPILKRLEQSGLLRRSRRSTDEREVEITLTPAGAALRERALEVRRKVVRELKMSDAQIGMLRRELDDLTHTLGEAGLDC